MGTYKALQLEIIHKMEELIGKNQGKFMIFDRSPIDALFFLTIQDLDLPEKKIGK
jgi:hypothetical protein